MYGMTLYRPQKYYFADIRSPCGGVRWDYTRTNLGRQTAYALIIKQNKGDTIYGFRDENSATAFDKKAIAQILSSK